MLQGCKSCTQICQTPTVFSVDTKETHACMFVHTVNGQDKIHTMPHPPVPSMAHEMEVSKQLRGSQNTLSGHGCAIEIQRTISLTVATDPSQPTLRTLQKNRRCECPQNHANMSRVLHKLTLCPTLCCSGHHFMPPCLQHSCWCAAAECCRVGCQCLEIAWLVLGLGV